MKVANIVSNTSENVSEDFNVVKSLYETIQGLPTLIVGWDYVKKSYPNYNIIERRVEDSIFWTFKKTENRELHDQDLYNFSVNTYKDLVKDIKYHFVDAFTLSMSQTKRFLKLVQNEHLVSYHYTHSKKNIDMIYMLIKNNIYGIDLNLLKYMGFSREKILNKIRKHSGIFLDQNYIFIEYEKGLELLDNQVKFIPFLYTIKNG